jgi:hypothetical protein
MPKKSKVLGKNTSASAEIQNISNQGIWILINGQEFFMPFKKFPWFLNATIQQIYNLEFFHGKHLHWPSLDVDIEVESLKHPDAYPLKYS